MQENEIFQRDMLLEVADLKLDTLRMAVSDLQSENSRMDFKVNILEE